MTAKQRLHRDIERNEAKLRKAEEQCKHLKEKRRELEKQAYSKSSIARYTAKFQRLHFSGINLSSSKGYHLEIIPAVSQNSKGLYILVKWIYSPFPCQSLALSYCHTFQEHRCYFDRPALVDHLQPMIIYLYFCKAQIFTKK